MTLQAAVTEWDMQFEKENFPTHFHVFVDEADTMGAVYTTSPVELTLSTAGSIA